MVRSLLVLLVLLTLSAHGQGRRKENPLTALKARFRALTLKAGGGMGD